MQRNKRWKALFDKWLQRSIIQKEFEKRFKLILEISKPIFGQLSWEFDEFENLTFRCIITSFLESYFDDLFQSNCICKWSTLIQIEIWNGRYCVYMLLSWPFSKINFYEDQGLRLKMSKVFLYSLWISVSISIFFKGSKTLNALADWNVNFLLGACRPVASKSNILLGRDAADSFDKRFPSDRID